MAATPSTCVFCKRDLPHERHVTQLEYLRIFGEAETYANDVCVLDKPGVYRMDPTAAAKGRVVA